MSHQLPVIEFRKVLCVDPCDPKGLKTRRVCLLVQSDPCSLRNAKVEISQPSAWKSEPKLVNPVRLVDSIETDTIVQEIHVIDPAFGNQLLQYITAREPIKPGMEIPEGNISTDSNLVGSLWDPGTSSARLRRGLPPYQTLLRTLACLETKCTWMVLALSSL